MLFFARHLYAKRSVAHSLRKLSMQRISFSDVLPEIRIRFLIDYFGEENYQTEAGVSYLISAGGHTLLFDLGFNQHGHDPSPLVANLRAMGLADQKIDGVFISHNHLDHVGGYDQMRKKTPNLSQLGKSTSDLPVWTPTELTGCQTISRPDELLPGIASTGPLPAHLYFVGHLQEQALLLARADRGVVLVTGCGHPGIVEMVRCATEQTGQTVDTVIGGLHLIVSQGRTRTQKYLGANQPPWAFPTEKKARSIAHNLYALGVRTVAPSAHDSCDVALGILKEVFGDGYVDLRVGGEMLI